MSVLYDYFWIILVIACLSLVITDRFRFARNRSDRDRIQDEADSKHCDVLSIRGYRLPFCHHGPFSWVECLPRYSRLYRVQARERSGKERTAYVLIGPRRLVSDYASREDRYGTLTWRWEEKRR
jgi:hypothetical protein